MSSSPTVSQQFPRLENGDRLTRREFERRYHRMPNLKKAELIEGTVYMAQDDYHWLLTLHHDINGTISLDSLGVEIAIADLYDRIEFPKRL